MFATSILGWTISTIWMIMILIAWVFIAFWPARIAGDKGHSFIGFFIFSIFFFPLALLVAFLVSDKTKSSSAPTEE